MSAREMAAPLVTIALPAATVNAWGEDGGTKARTLPGVAGWWREIPEAGPGWWRVTAVRRDPARPDVVEVDVTQEARA